jgi:hypothetical protein
VTSPVGHLWGVALGGKVVASGLAWREASLQARACGGRAIPHWRLMQEGLMGSEPPPAAAPRPRAAVAANRELEEAVEFLDGALADLAKWLGPGWLSADELAEWRLVAATARRRPKTGEQL